MILNNCHYILLNYTLALLHQCVIAWFISLLFISFMQLVNGVQLLNVNFLFPLLGAAAASVFVAVIDPLAIMYASLQSNKLDLSSEV